MISTIYLLLLSAVRLHESKVVADTENYQVLADAQQNPKRRTVYTWHDLWRKENFGSIQAPLVTLKSKVSKYAEQGTNDN